MMPFYYPCKPNPLSPESEYFEQLDNDKAYAAELKKNGWRVVIYRQPSSLEIWTRHHKLITTPLIQIRTELIEQLPANSIIDGELLFTKRIKGFPDALYLFDVIQWKGDLVVNSPLSERRKHLDIIKPSNVITIAEQVRVGKRKLFERAISQYPENEGIVIKRLDSKYLINRTVSLQHPQWLKVKKEGA